jgi:hypothetical protein
MPTPDASQFTQQKRYTAINKRLETGGSKLVDNHLYQYVPIITGLPDFLSSFSNKNTKFIPRFIRWNITTGSQQKARVNNRY